MLNESVKTSFKSKRSSAKLMKKLSPWLFVLPGIIFTAWLRYIPIFKSLYMSFFNYDAITPPGKFVGIQNYIEVLSSKFYWDAWVNTLVFLVLNLVLVFFIPIIQAILLNEIFKGRKMFTTIYLITALIPISVNVILWKWIWHPEYGLANQIITFFGGKPQIWLSNPSLTKFAIVFPGIIGGGVAVLMYLAAIQGISSEIFEASQIDGCTGWKKIKYIIFPNIKFLIIIQLILSVIGSMQILDAPYQFASGGPSGASTSMGIYIYNAINQDLSYGRGSVASFILFIVIAVMTTFEMKLDNSERE